MSKETHCFKVGTSECIIVSDGTFAYPHPAQIFRQCTERTAGTRVERTQY